MSEQKIWTVEDNENANSLSRISTASTKQIGIQLSDHPYLVGVQSRFRRKYFHKTIFVVLTILIIILLVTVIILACFLTPKQSYCETKECVRSAANLLQSMDQNVDPCDDFYKFTCGNWPDEHPRPDSSSSHDWFTERQTKVLRKIREFLQSNLTTTDPLPVNQARMMYKACMDTTKMDALGIEPVIAYLKMYGLPIYPTILNITKTDYSKYKFDWLRSLVEIKKTFGADLMIGFDIFPDPTNRSLNRLVMGTPELGSDLPFKDDFEKKLLKRKQSTEMYDSVEEESAESKDIEDLASKAYTSYISEVMALMVLYVDPSVKIDEHTDKIQESAELAVKMTKLIFKMTQEAENATKNNNTNPLQDIVNVYVSDLQNISDSAESKNPLNLSWSRYLTMVFENTTEVKLDLTKDTILTSKADLKYIELLMDFLSETTVAQLELYIWWSTVEELIVHTTSDIREMHWQYARSVTNLEGSTGRSLYCTGGVNKLLGMGVSYAIATSNFLNETKPMVEMMLTNIRVSFDSLVLSTTWMDEQTKKSTLEKSAAMKSLIGFPDWILKKDKLEEFYSGIVINETQHLNNMMGILKWRMSEKLKKLKTENVFGWATIPTNVNAFHTFQANAITIPLAILQYPFYHLGLEALNYGAIGTILGHELTHGFDDSGRQFDKNGNMRQWWSNQTVTEYINRTKCFVNQYENYYLPEVNDHVNGELTLGENIADNGGLREAFYAYRLYVNQNGKEQYLPGLLNYTHEQLFFISFGNMWCEQTTVSATRWSLEDSHCPGRVRLRGVLSNSPEFSQSFGCKRNATMDPINKCRIW